MTEKTHTANIMIKKVIDYFNICVLSFAEVAELVYAVGLDPTSSESSSLSLGTRVVCS